MEPMSRALLLFATSIEQITAKIMPCEQLGAVLLTSFARCS